MGGITDVIIQRTIELLQSMPAIPIWLALSGRAAHLVGGASASLLPSSSRSSAGPSSASGAGRFLALREEDFVTSARLIGSSRRRIIFSHMVPSFMSHIIASTTRHTAHDHQRNVQPGLGSSPPATLGRAVAGSPEPAVRSERPVVTLPGVPWSSRSWCSTSWEMDQRCRRPLQQLTRARRQAASGEGAPWTRTPRQRRP